MSKLHIANTFFEWELETNPNCSLTEAFHQNPIFTQLQFLPVLYADANDGILITENPPSDYLSIPKLFTYSNPCITDFQEIEAWGPSKLIAEFANGNHISYSIPDWEVVRQVNSKQFSFESSPKLIGATLLENEPQAKQWFHSFEGAKVLKTCYGVSGKGHLISDDWEKIAPFLKREWEKSLPVIAEPWVNRVLDFSTQWVIQKDKEILYEGSTLCYNDSRGQYRFNEVGDEKTLFGPHLHFLYEHIQVAKPLLSKIANLGFFGNIGIDAMLYNEKEETLLHPIVEINARKTMGWAALTFQKKNNPKSTLRFSYTTANTGHLPQTLLTKNGKTIHFKRNLTIEKNGH